MADSQFLTVAKEAAIEAGKIVAKYRNEELHLTKKAHVNDIVTQADVEAEKVVIRIIKEAFPGHSILAEESGADFKDSEYTWAIDPIDGTTDFISGIPFYAVSVGLLKNKQPYVGVINLVGQSELYWAEKGQGAYVNGKQITVSTRAELQDAYLFLDLGGVEREKRLESRVKPFMNKIRAVFMAGSATLEMVYTARGFTDGFILKANPWDFTAGTVILKEAGGKVSDYRGKEIDWTKKKIQIIGSNNLLHKEIIKTLDYKGLEDESLSLG
jgi:myo-inositol-1(or 4)-monophosphatase